MRIFYKNDGGIIQLIGKEKIKEWSIELPLLFVEYIRNNKLDSYDDPKVKKEIENYLDEILEDIAVPRLIEVLGSDDNEEIISALKRILEIAENNLDMTRPIRSYLEDLTNKKNKEIVNLTEQILDLFRKADRRKELNKKRKVMQEKEELFLAGKISAEEYATSRKEYLKFRDNR
ncbi:MAG: hypothetical protein P8Y70_13940 [Candidatus Lokiarchaeota archaeon]